MTVYADKRILRDMGRMWKYFADMAMFFMRY
jgi:hypothetical protein